MQASLTDYGGFVRHGPAEPVHPVVVTVPHAGRDYPAGLLMQARVPKLILEGMEDRHCDLLVEGAIADGATVFIAQRPRTWIDLNRSEREIDRAMLVPPPPVDMVEDTAKVRGGLGLVPRRGPGGVELWRGRIAADELARRIVRDHRPWHSAIAAAMDAAVARFGVAVLFDCHSMPPLPMTGGVPAAQVVIGDRNGRSSAAHCSGALADVAEAAALRTAANRPYAGGYALARHGIPREGRHAVQVEIDRSLYLDRSLRDPGSGLPATLALITAMVRALAAEAVGTDVAIAAE